MKVYEVRLQNGNSFWRATHEEAVRERQLLGHAFSKIIQHDVPRNSKQGLVRWLNQSNVRSKP